MSRDIEILISAHGAWTHAKTTLSQKPCFAELKRASCVFSFFIACFWVAVATFCPATLNAQQKIAIHLTEPETAHYSIVRQGEHRAGELNNSGMAELSLQRKQEYAITVYADQYKPVLISFSTFDIDAPAFSLTVKLEKLNPGDDPLDFQTGRSESLSHGKLNITQFDLESISQRAQAVMALSEARKILNAFYLEGKKTPPFHNRTDDFTPARIEESSRQIARRLFTAEKELEHFRAQREKLSARIQPADCNSLQAYWRARTAEDKAARDVQELRMHYQMAAQAKKEMQGGQFDRDAFNRQNLTLESAQNRYEISLLQSRSQYADCLSRILQADIDSLEKAGLATSIEARQKRMQIERARVEEQAATAYRMYRKHNQQAHHLTGREQWEELARAQKQIANYNKAQHMAARVRQELTTIDLELNPGNRQFVNAAERAQKEVDRWSEIQYQSDMGYAEWMWALRKQLDVPEMADDLYARQSRLLDISPLSSRNIDTDANEDVAILKNAGLNISADASGSNRSLRYGDDTYEIIQHADGTFSYRKNNRPITALTYRFETERIFGEFLKNISVEENRSGLREVFRRVSGLD